MTHNNLKIEYCYYDSTFLVIHNHTLYIYREVLAKQTEHFIPGI